MGGTIEGEGVEFEIRASVPRGVRTIRVHLDLGGAASRAGADSTQLSVGGGRKLPPLLFATSRAALAANVGAVEASQALDAITAAGQRLFDQIPAGLTDSQEAVRLVQAELRAFPDCEGVVLVGGYDVVPSRRLDCLPPSIRSAVGQTQDGDDFIVWSDEAYGDANADQIADVAVSRIPDGKSAALLFAALSAGGQGRPQPRRGVRNVARPFADGVFNGLSGTESILVSQPTIGTTVPELDADLVYLMLHGDYLDSTRFWGEETANDEEAVNVTNIPALAGRVVFTGCCWGALTVDQPALRALPNNPPAPKATAASMALSFLNAGVVGYLGCTGSHYSPTEPPYDYFGGPMHEAFFQASLAGAAPAPALFEAKAAYRAGFPHGQTSPISQAIEYKILNQYTCLGLGW